MGKKYTIQEIKERFKKVHGDLYSYELITDGYSAKDKMPIVCKEHGVFYQTFDKHYWRKQGCPKCAKNHKKKTEEFVKCAKDIHGDKYSYPEEYVNNEKKIKIVCPIHGEFYQTPHMHLLGQGCPKCYGNEVKSTETFIEECKKVHGDKYDYSKTEYKNAYSRVVITCPQHGDFVQIARTHLYGHGCPECSEKKKFDKDYFFKKAREKHGDRYDYSLITEIKNSRSKVPIICKNHGVFYQSVDNHINQNQGCPKCKRSLLEEKIALFLEKQNIKFEEQKTFTWLKPQKLDFYLPQYNVAIECQGIQHFGEYGTFGGNISQEDFYKNIYDLDERKNKLCRENNVNLIYYAECDLPYRYSYFKTTSQILEYILSNAL